MDEYTLRFSNFVINRLCNSSANSVILIAVISGNYYVEFCWKEITTILHFFAKIASHRILGNKVDLSAWSSDLSFSAGLCEQYKLGAVNSNKKMLHN